ncbi:MAG: cell division protease FtsH [Parcubacteria group bacterium Gr01-1014_19]|nr:MAG: cell division protease FtsH [Parcubacteria group bacterium Gr01-1014_19]
MSGPKDRAKKRPPGFPRLFRFLIFVLLGFALFTFFGKFFSRGPAEKKISIDELYAEMDKGAISELNVDPVQGLVSGKFKDGVPFSTQVADRNKLEAKALEKGIKVTANSVGPSIWAILLQLLFYALMFGLPIIILLWWMGSRQGGNNKPTGYIPDVTWDDVAGCEEVKKELKQVVDFLKDPEKYRSMGARAARGVLLVGAPGTGKTMFAKATAREAGVPFYDMCGSEFVEMFVGVGASRVRDIFKKARETAPCIIFIDEIDGLCRQRGTDHPEREQTLNQLLKEMDGFKSNEAVVLMGATNRPELMDSAVMRPGRFDLKILVPPPDVVGREAILKVHSRGKPLGPDVDLREIAKGTPGMTGADLENVMNAAALIALERKHLMITREDINEGVDKSVLGEARKRVISPFEKKVVAFHEAGHTLVAKKTPGADSVRKVTIIPRGFAGGVTWMMPEEDKTLPSEPYFRGQMKVMMGGRAAEMLIFKQASSGAQGDFRQITDSAKKMIKEYGMGGDEVGLIHYGDEAVNTGFLGMSFGRSGDWSEVTKQKIDEAIRKLVAQSYEDAYELLKMNQRALEMIAGALLERETLLSDEIDQIIQTADEFDKVNQNIP